MAAPMTRFMKPKSLANFIISAAQPRRTAASCTYVLLPEVPPDTAETNTLMNTESLPQFSQITPASVFRASGKLAILYDTGLSEHDERLSDLGTKATFEDIFEPLEELSVPLQHSLRCVQHLSTVKKKTFADAYEGILTHSMKSRMARFTMEMLFQRIKELNAHPEALTETQQALVSMYLRESRHLGIELVGKQKDNFHEHNKYLSREEDLFRRNVYFTSRKYSHTVYSPSDLGNMPQQIKNKISLNRENPEAGPWRFGIDSTAVSGPVMSYCPNRELRKDVWRNLVNVGGVWHNVQGLSNKFPIINIRYARKMMANQLGYNTWSDMVMEHSMAGSVQNVMEVLETLRSAFQPEAQKEAESLQSYATANGLDEPMKVWDVAYYMTQQQNEIYGIDDAKISEYFPLPRVLHALFQICNGLFGINIKQREFGSVDVWHPSVHVYDVFDEDGTHKGIFYLDPYTRMGDKYGGSWIEPGREKSSLIGAVPLSFVNLNLTPSLGSKPALMDFSDVVELFGMFGHTLQQLLTTVPYSEIAGQNNIESDGKHVSSFLMSMWLLRPDTLKSVSCHWESNQPLPEADVKNLVDDYYHMYSHKLMKRLFLSVYDLEMHFSDTHFDTAMRRLWPRYMLYPLEKEDGSHCSMVDVFGQRKSASNVYIRHWNEMIAADVMKSFNESENMEDLKATGRRFKETYLYSGGSVPASEVFRRFKGRDPSISSLLEMRLPNQQSEKSDSTS